MVNGGGGNRADRFGPAWIVRALVKMNAELVPLLRKADLMTRDPREKERKKPSLKRSKAPTYTEALNQRFVNLYCSFNLDRFAFEPLSGFSSKHFR